MNENVIIKISATHIMADKESEDHDINDSYKGNYSVKNDSHYIIYHDIDEDTGQKTINTIKLKDNMLTIVKKGQAKSTMIFEKGNIHKSDYVTPFGTFGISTKTKNLDVKFHKNGLDVKLEYSLNLNDIPSSECKMVIDISFI